MIIGVDIGGTNTDAVLVDQDQKIVCAVKTATTENIAKGFSEALSQLLAKARIPSMKIGGVFVGTTHATNAILQKKGLYRVGLIRIAGHKPDTLPPGYSWPVDLKQPIIAAFETIAGGFECDGSSLTPFCEKETRSAIEKVLAQGVESIAVVGTFAPLNSAQELRVAELVGEIAGKDFPVSLSHQLGGIGFIERENSTLLNASLKHVMEQGFRDLKSVCQTLQLTCPLMVTQNDGSLIDLERAIAYPVLTISAGPTNSFIGGCRLAQLDHAIVVDIGGTSTDVGLVKKGFPIRSLNKSNIGGIALNFPMPDVLSIALGGGSVLQFSKEIAIGPQSVGKEMHKAIAFGGTTLTLTDAAIAMGHLQIENALRSRIPLHPVEGKIIFDRVNIKIETLIAKMRGEHKDLPVIYVGGGSALLPPSNHLIPEHFQVANAYGAALSEISGTIDAVVSLEKREKMLESLYEQAKQKALEQGADSQTLRLIDQQILPYHYVPNQMARVIVRVSGKRR